MGSGICIVDERRELARRFGGNGGHFVAESQVEGQVRLELVVVLNVAAVNRLAKIPRRLGCAEQRLKRGRLIQQELLQPAKGVKAVRARALRELVRLNAFRVERPASGNVCRASRRYCHGLGRNCSESGIH